jgi:hypothetical protein
MLRSDVQVHMWSKVEVWLSKYLSDEEAEVARVKLSMLRAGF